MLHTLGLVQASAWWKWSRRGVARHRCQHQRLARASQGWAYKLPPSWSTWSRVATIQSYTKYKYKIQNTNTKYKPPTQLVYLIKSGYYTGLHKIQIQNTRCKIQIQIQAPTQLVYLIKSGYYTGLHKHKTQTHTLTLQCSTNRKVSQPNHKIYNPFQLICITNSQVNTLHRKKELGTFVWSICWLELTQSTGFASENDDPFDWNHIIASQAHHLRQAVSCYASDHSPMNIELGNGGLGDLATNPTSQHWVQQCSVGHSLTLQPQCLKPCTLG